MRYDTEVAVISYNTSCNIILHHTLILIVRKYFFYFFKIWFCFLNNLNILSQKVPFLRVIRVTFTTSLFHHTYLVPGYKTRIVDSFECLT